MPAARPVPPPPRPRLAPSRSLPLLLLLLSAALAGCGKPSDDPQTQERNTPMLTVKSAAFENGMPIPKKYTGEGPDVSPPLSWGPVPGATKELVLICDDPDAPTPQPWVHWLLYNLPPDLASLPEGGLPDALQGKNSFGTDRYSGPMPPPGHGVHHYHFRLYALNAKTSLPAGATKSQLLKAIQDHVLAQGELVGAYERR